MEDLTQLYIAISELVPETVKVEKVRRTSESTNESGDPVYNFIAIVAAPTNLSDIKASENDCQRIMQFSKRKLKIFGGPDIKCQVKWQKKDGKTGKFDISAHLSPENISGIEVNDGVMRITCKAYGVFFT